MAPGKRSDPAAIRRDQRKIAEDQVNRDRTQREGDVVSTPRPRVSPPAKPKPIAPPKRTQPTSRRGVVTGFRKGSNLA